MKWKFTQNAPPGKKLLAGLALACALSASSSALYAAPVPPLPADAEYSVPRLAPDPATYGWSNLIPNALANYYTFQPLTTTDAHTIGFNDFTGPNPLGGPPMNHICGNLAAGDTGSTNDCYVISVKRFTQPLGLEALTASITPNPFAGWGMGLIAPNGEYYGPTNTNPAYRQWTDVFGYGSGGRGWTPPQYVYDNTVPISGIRRKTTGDPGGLKTIQGNAPAPYFNSPPGTTVPQPEFIMDGIWHFPAPSIKGTKGRPIRVQWVNELPNLPAPGFDPTIDCGDTVPNGFPYNRIVTHVHGAHVGPESDGLTHGGYNPDYSNVGYKFSQTILPEPYKSANPPGTYFYPMDQEAATIWYHDHAIGITHLNTNQGMAGFFPITDANEQTLKANNILPSIDGYDLGFALQERIFGANDGQFIMPDAPVIDGKFPSCDPATPASRLATCSPLFMYARHDANPSSLTTAGIHLVPYDEFSIDLTIPENTNSVTGAPLLATSSTLEFFGNLPVVNGTVYGKYNVQPTVYRMRFIGGTDSRTWLLRLVEYDGTTNAVVKTIPWWQVGTEQGLLPKPVKRTEMLLMPGERLDAIVDFSVVTAGNYVMMKNLGPDGPFQGEDLLTLPGSLNQSKDIPDVMKFVVSGTDGNALVTKPSANEVAYANTALNTLPTITVNARQTRVIALEEIVDEYERIMPTIDRRGYDILGMQTTELIRQNDVEQWDIVNTTADAHPMHLHQVAFQVIDRIPFTSFTPAINDIAAGVFAQPSYTYVPGTEVLPDPHDAGLKDTVYTPPGFVTRVKALFDLTGEYVWHCHILSHEEHDMMRPMTVVPTANVLAAPAISVPASSLDNRDATISITPAAPPNPVAEKYYVEYKKPTDANWTTNALSSTTSQTITFPSDGIYNVRVKAVDAAQYPTYADSNYTAAGNQIVVAPSDQITSPVTTLSGATQTFTFTTSGTYPHYLWLGTTGAGSSNLGRLGALSGVSQITANNLPVDGSTVYARLWVKVGTGHMAEMRYRDYTFTAVTINKSVLTTPATNGVTMSGSSQVFNWTDVGATLYQLHVGSTGVGSSNVGVYPATPAAVLTATPTNLPIDGRALNVRLYSQIGGKWYFNDYTFTAAAPSAMLSPTSPSTLTGTSQAFSWGNVGGDLYQLHVGSTGAGSSNIGLYPATPTTATTTTVTGLPTDGRSINVRLYTKFGTKWYSRDYTYTATSPAVITSPLSPAIVGSGQVFNWNNVGADLYQIHIGSTGVGSSNVGVYPPAPTTATTATATWIPRDGRTLNIRLYTKFGTKWYSNDYTYTASGP